MIFVSVIAIVAVKYRLSQYRIDETFLVKFGAIGSHLDRPAYTGMFVVEPGYDLVFAFCTPF